MKATSNQADVSGVVAALEAGAASMTLCEVASGIGLVSSGLDGIAVYQVIAGTLHLHLSSGERHRVTEGSLVLVPAGVEPVLAADDRLIADRVDGRDCLRRRGPWLVADATHGRDAELILAATRIRATSTQHLIEVTQVSLRRDRIGRQLSKLLHDEVLRPGPANNAIAVSLMTACVIAALRIAATAENGAGSRDAAASSSPVLRAVAAMRSAPTEDHRIEDLARLSGMSRATFLRQFAKAMHCSPNQFLLDLRLREAAAMLRAQLDPIKTIAARAGFASRSYFSRAFREAFGVDPTTYRNQVDDERREKH